MPVGRQDIVTLWWADCKAHTWQERNPAPVSVREKLTFSSAALFLHSPADQIFLCSFNCQKALRQWTGNLCFKKAWVLCNNMSAEVYFAAFWAVIGFSGCCCSNGTHTSCRKDWMLLTRLFSSGMQNITDIWRWFTDLCGWDELQSIPILHSQPLWSSCCWKCVFFFHILCQEMCILRNKEFTLLSFFAFWWDCQRFLTF